MSWGEIHFKESTESTMEDARTAVRAGAGHGTVYRAGCQIAGRGRIPGRRWDDGGESLLFTIVLDRNRVNAAYPLTQLLAHCLCRHLEDRWHIRPSIKWPNDVLIQGAKIAGILVETEGTFYLAGLGLNLNQTSFPPDLRRPAVSLATAAFQVGRSVPRAIRAEDELKGFLAVLQQVLAAPPDISAIIARMDRLGRRVSIRLGHPDRLDRLTGTIRGLQEDGALLVQDDTGDIHPIYSGEIEEIHP